MFFTENGGFTMTQFLGNGDKARRVSDLGNMFRIAKSLEVTRRSVDGSQMLTVLHGVERNRQT